MTQANTTQAMQVVTRIILTYTSEILGTLAWTGAAAQLWLLPMLLYMNIVDFSQATKWTAWTVLTMLLAFPSGRFHSVTGLPTLTWFQHMLFRRAGSRAIPIVCDLGRLQQLCTTCARSCLRLLPPTFIKIVSL